MRSLMNGMVAAIRAVFIREIVENYLFEVSIESKEQAVAACIEEVEDRLGFMVDGEDQIIVGVVERTIEGSPKARGRKPTAKDYQSWIETCKCRMPLYPGKWDKGYDSSTDDPDWDQMPSWASWPEVVLWHPGDKDKGTKGKWMPMANSTKLLKSRGISQDDIETWLAGKDVPEVKIRIQKAHKSGWVYETQTRYLINGAWSTKRPQGPILGQTVWQARQALSTPEKEDVLGVQPFVSKDTTTPMIRYTLHPSTGIWDAGFYLKMREAGIYIAYRVVVVDSPEGNDGACPKCGYHHITIHGIRAASCPV